MEFYKDSYDINQRSALGEKLKELSNIVCKGNYEEVLLPHPRKEFCHNVDHIRCSLRISNGIQRITEKRICRCWNYYNKDIHQEKCDVCDFGFKKKNAGSITICDYEVPTDFSMDNLGGIDWLLCDGTQKIAAEVKPPNSTETLARMIAEILTYTIETVYTPAICFFKTQMDGKTPSKQMKDYLKYKDNKDFLSIQDKTGLKVLYITFDDNFFIIHDIEK